MAYSQNFPAQRPVFQFNADAGRVSPNMAFSRASTGTFFGTDKVLSSENLLPYSNNVSATEWTKSRVTVDSVNNSAPDGGSDAALILETTDNNTHTYYDGFTCVSGTNYSLTFYAKPNGRTKISVLPQATGIIATLVFDLVGAGTVTLSSGSTVSHSITQVGDWYKCQVTVTATGSGTGFLQVFLDNGSGTSYAGDVTKGIYVWGHQVSSTGETVLNETSGSIHREYQTKLQTAASGAARFEHSATDGQSMGVLVESQATNLVTYSEDFANWSATRSQVESNAAIGPDGTLSADRFAEDASEGGSNSHYMQSNFTTTNSTQYTMSVYAKHGGGANRYCQLRVMGVGSGFAFANFDLSNGTYVGGGGSIRDSYSISSVGNGWHRLTMTFTNNPSGGTVNGMGIILAAANSELHQYTSDDYSGILLYGAQCETGSFGSSLVGTSGASATRAADSLSVASSDFGLSGGPVSVVGEFSFLEDEASPVGSWNSAPRLMRIAGSSDEVEIFRNVADGANTLSVNVEVNGTDYQTLATSTNTGVGVDYKVGLSLQSGSIKGCMDGGVVGENTNAVFPDISSSTLYVGSINTTQGHVNGYCKRLAIYSEALSNTNLQAITS